jgi:hypothetical protein
MASLAFRMRNHGTAPSGSVLDGAMARGRQDDE